MARVCLEGITQKFGKTVAVQDVSFEIPDGKLWVMVGPSGCGKSTLLRAIAGLEPVVEGQLYIGDRCVNQVPARQRDVAMVFQNYALYPHMTVAENLAFGLRMRQVPKDEQMRQASQVAQSLHIEHLLDRKPAQLSGGQQQRVALGRAIARRPKVFLLDEPLSNLDAQLRDDTRAELKQLHHQFGITTLYVTHDQVEAMTLGDQIVMLDQGHVQQIGPPQVLYGYPANRRVATFIGNPPMNTLQGVFDGTYFQINGQRLPAPAEVVRSALLSPNQWVSLGIRPEHVILAPNDDHALSVSIELVEPLGREILVRGQVLGRQPDEPDQIVNFFVQPPKCPLAGEELQLAFDSHHLFLFDSVGGQTIYPTPTMAN